MRLIRREVGEISQEDPGLQSDQFPLENIHQDVKYVGNLKHMAIASTADCEPRESESKPRKKKVTYSRFGEFSSNTSLHGLKFIGDSERTMLERIWWSIVVAISFSMCCYLITKIWIKWQERPVIVSFEERITPIWHLPYPAVTVCPVQKSKKSLFNYTDACLNRGSLSRSQKITFDLTSIFCEVSCGNRFYPNLQHGDIVKYKNVALTADDVIHKCYGLMSSTESCDAEFSTQMTDMGMCFSLNMLSAEELFSKEADANRELINYDRNTSHGWTMEQGFPKNSPLFTYPYRMKAKGKLNPLELYLTMLEKNTDDLCSAEQVGFYVTIHPPNSIPDMKMESFYVDRETDVTISIVPSMTVTSPQLQNYDPQKRQCYFAKERKLKYFEEYTRNNCELECLTNFTMARCKCVTMMMPRSKSTPVCGFLKKQCVSQAADTFNRMEILADPDVVRTTFSRRYKNSSLQAMKCDCLPSCTSLNYEINLSQTKFDRDKYFYKYHRYVDNYTKFERVIFSKVNIYIKNAHFIKTKRTEIYATIDFLANCGGLLGVFLGFSFLSLMEIFYFFLVRPFCGQALN